MKTKLYTSFFVIVIITTSIYRDASSQMFWNHAANLPTANQSIIRVNGSANLNSISSYTLEAWVYPHSAFTSYEEMVITKRTSLSSFNGYTLLLEYGKVSVLNAGTGVIGNTVIPANKWTHIAGTYNSSTNVFRVYVNGILDKTATILNADPIPNSDSIKIGRFSAFPYYSYLGYLDEVRIWNRDLSAAEILKNMRTSLGTSTGIYSSLLLSITFQNKTNTFPVFDINDWSNNSNFPGTSFIYDIDQTNVPYVTIFPNESVKFDGSRDYLSGPDNSSVSPTNKITLEAWIFPLAYSSAVLIHKGNDNGTITNYRLGLSGRKILAGINNNFSFLSADSVPLSQWSHVAFTYYGATGHYEFYLNGQLSDSGINNQGNITNGTDSLYIGGTIQLTNFNGYIDEVRITKNLKTNSEINKYLYKSIDDANNEEGSFQTVYNLDGYAWANAGSGPLLNFRFGAGFSAPGTQSGVPVSPLTRADSLNFSDGFFIKKSENRRIPATSTIGNMTDDSLYISYNTSISDVNFFIAANHTFSSDMGITLVDPSGRSVPVCIDYAMTGANGSIVTVFNDQAASQIGTSYTSFTPTIRAQTNMSSAFNGHSSGGYWRLKIADDQVGDTGRLYAWGVQINNMTTLPKHVTINSLVQGFYDLATNLMVQDTMRYYFRKTISPYTLIDSSKAFLTTSGSAILTLTNIQTYNNYYIVLKHRNSIETWSNNSFALDPLNNQGIYDFTNDSAMAYGLNLKRVDSSPVKYAIYSGDENKDGTIDVADIVNIYNDVLIGNSGYISTDVNGDDFADVSDLIITYNNAINVVGVIAP